MNLFSKMRITHKISALMIALVAGFILIGITYYFQVNISESARRAEQDAFVYQQMLSELKQFELNLKFQSKQVEALSPKVAIEQAEALREAINTKLSEINALSSVRKNNLSMKSFEDAVDDYNTALVEKIDAISSLRSTDSSNIKSEIESSISAIDNALSGVIAASVTEAFASLKFSINTYLNTATEASKEQIEESSKNLIYALNTLETKAINDSQQEELQNTIGVVTTRALSLGEDFFTANTNLSNSESALSMVLTGLQQKALELSNQTVEEASEVYQATQAAVTAIIFVVAMGTAIGIYLIYKSIVFPMAHMQNVINRINRGKTKARVKILTNDEMADLGTAFNKLFDERINQLETQSRENDRLNNSIIALIQALGSIAKKDLTIKVPVSSDITGTISDAVNLLTAETAATLYEVKGISQEVNQASEVLQDQSKKVMQFAESERMQITATSKALKVLAGAMAEVAEQSELADKSANQAIVSTHTAKKAVNQTVSGIRSIRETISETEKRTKRLGDRSQEISGIVNLINTIAERTHILALNASMHAASAGEAGKGFAVVAEEVQRLAESARQSTDEISAMVNNMRVETSDTVNIMNKLISQVADGSKMAEQAGEAMQSTEEATRELVTTVKQISSQAIQQASVANRVKDRAAIIRNFTDKTEKQLEEQNIYTENLRKYAESLVENVNVFRLPQDDIPVISAKADTSNVSPIKSAV